MHMEITLLLEQHAPVPCASETSVDTAPHIVKVIRATAVKCVSEKVTKDFEVEHIERTTFGIDVCTQCRRLVPLVVGRAYCRWEGGCSRSVSTCLFASCGVHVMRWIPVGQETKDFCEGRWMGGWMEPCTNEQECIGHVVVAHVDNG